MERETVFCGTYRPGSETRRTRKLLVATWIASCRALGWDGTWVESVSSSKTETQHIEYRHFQQISLGAGYENPLLFYQKT